MAMGIAARADDDTDVLACLNAAGPFRALENTC